MGTSVSTQIKKGFLKGDGLLTIQKIRLGGSHAKQQSANSRTGSSRFKSD